MGFIRVNETFFHFLILGYLALGFLARRVLGAVQPCHHPLAEQSLEGCSGAGIVSTWKHEPLPP